jgi:hypothetical protein
MRPVSIPGERKQRSAELDRHRKKTESRHALASCSVVLSPIRLTIARAAARQVSSMLMCGICARVVSVEPNIIVAIALAIIAIFEMAVLSLDFADLLSLIEIATILTRASVGPLPHFRPQHELSRGFAIPHRTSTWIAVAKIILEAMERLSEPALCGFWYN